MCWSNYKELYEHLCDQLVYILINIPFEQSISKAQILYQRFTPPKLPVHALFVNGINGQRRGILLISWITLLYRKGQKIYNIKSLENCYLESFYEASKCNLYNIIESAVGSLAPGSEQCTFPRIRRDVKVYNVNV